MPPTSSWYHVPSPGQRVRREALQIKRGGRTWSASWTVDGDRLYVESAYGSRTALAGRERGRVAKAEALLAEIVDQRVRP
jgi:hypothetical protein